MAKKREFSIPSAERTAVPADPAEPCCCSHLDGEMNVRSRRRLRDRARSPDGRAGRRLDTLLSVAAARGQARIREGLRGRTVRLANGREPNPNSSADFVKLLLEQAADPAVTRIVFYRECAE